MAPAPRLIVGSSRQPKVRNSTPTTARPIPTGAKSNMRNGSPVICSRICDTTMLGEVPIRVIRPPSREPNASGMSTRDTGFWVRRATCIAIGMKMASAPMFLMKADSAVTADASTATCM